MAAVNHIAYRARARRWHAAGHRHACGLWPLRGPASAAVPVNLYACSFATCLFGTCLFGTCLVGTCLFDTVAYGQFATVLNVPPDEAPAAIGSNTQLNLFVGGSLEVGFEVGAPNGTSTNAELNVVGGTVGEFLGIHGGSTMNVFAGTVGQFVDANFGSQVHVFGGTVGSFLDAESGSFINISGGSIGLGFQAHSGSLISISGGTAGLRFVADSGSEVHISGGTFAGDFNAASSSTVGLRGAAFMLDGVDLGPQLTLYEPFTILDRDVTLSGELATGDAFEFELASTDMLGNDYFDPQAVLTVTLVRRGDYNQNGVVDAPDFTLWRDTFGQRDDRRADGNGNGFVDAPDYNVWRDRFGLGFGAGVPEPSSLLLFGMGLFLNSAVGRRKQRTRPRLVRRATRQQACSSVRSRNPLG